MIAVPERAARAADEPGKKARGQHLLARQIVAYLFEQKLDRVHHLVETWLAERFAVSRTTDPRYAEATCERKHRRAAAQSALLPAQSLGATCARDCASAED
jgi:hypothetical protein